MKLCGTCKQVKPKSEFGSNKARKDGLTSACKICHNAWKAKSMATKRGHLINYLRAAKTRAKQQKVPFNIDLEYLVSIATDACPIYKTPFKWGVTGAGHKDDRPSLDKIVPELGYVKGNVAFICSIANRIKSNVTEKELYAIADWVHKKRKEIIKNVKQK